MRWAMEWLGFTFPLRAGDRWFSPYRYKTCSSYFLNITKARQMVNLNKITSFIEQMKEMTDKEFEKLLDEVAGERAENVTMHADPRYTETVMEKTINGGDYSVAYYYDSNGNPCKKIRGYRRKYCRILQRRRTHQ